MKILFLGNINNPLLVGLATGLKKKGHTIDFLSEAKSNNPELKQIFNKIIFINSESVFFRIPKVKMLAFTIANYKALKSLRSEYDICHIHYLSANYSFLIKSLQKKARKIVITVFGSDYYKSSRLIKRLQGRIVKIADAITFANKSTLNAFRNTFKVEKKKMFLCKYGLPILNRIKALKDIPKSKAKELLGLSSESFVITCGTNGSVYQQHFSIIESLVKIKSQLPEHYILVFPVTYGANKVDVDKLEMELRENGLKHLLFKNYLSNDDLSLLRVSSDILIQVQVTDQLSGAMQEHLYAGNVVITGAWLPYNEFVVNGIYFETVEKVSELGSRLVTIINDLGFYKNKGLENPEKIYNMCGMESAVERWGEVYRQVSQK